MMLLPRGMLRVVKVNVVQGRHATRTRERFETLTWHQRRTLSPCCPCPQPFLSLLPLLLRRLSVTLSVTTAVCPVPCMRVVRRA